MNRSPFISSINFKRFSIDAIKFLRFFRLRGNRESSRPYARLPAAVREMSPLLPDRSAPNSPYEQSETKKDINVVNRALSSFLLILVIQRQAKLNSASPIDATQFS